MNRVEVGVLFTVLGLAFSTIFWSAWWGSGITERLAYVEAEAASTTALKAEVVGMRHDLGEIHRTLADILAAVEVRRSTSAPETYPWNR